MPAKRPLRTRRHVNARALGALLSGAVATLTATVQAEPPARVIKGPYLQNLSATSVEIRAELAAPAPVTVTIGGLAGDAGAVRTIRDEHPATMHVIRVDGLTPSTRYSYSLGVAAAVAKGELTTAPPNDSTAPFTFLVYGDNRTDTVAHASVVHQMMLSPSDFIINTGDFVQDSADENWQSFFDVEGPLIRNRCVFACVGNHENRRWRRSRLPALLRPGVRCARRR